MENPALGRVLVLVLRLSCRPYAEPQLPFDGYSFIVRQDHKPARLLNKLAAIDCVGQLAQMVGKSPHRKAAQSNLKLWYLTHARTTLSPFMKHDAQRCCFVPPLALPFL